MKKLSDIKFDKNRVISNDELEKAVKELEKVVKKTEDNRKITDYRKLNRPMDI